MRKTAILRTTVLVAGKNGYESLLLQLAMEYAVQSLFTGSCFIDGMAAFTPEAAVGMVES